MQAAEIDTEIEEIAADKGYHSAGTIELCEALGLRTYLPEPKHAHDRTWTDKAPELRRAVYENRRRMKRTKGKRLGRLRSERVERSFAHVCDSGGMRRNWLPLAGRRDEAVPAIGMHEVATLRVLTTSR